MIHEANGTHDVEVTDNTRSIRWSDRGKLKLYLRIVLLINYMMEENLFVYVACSSVKHATSRYSVRKNITKKKK